MVTVLHAGQFRFYHIKAKLDKYMEVENSFDLVYIFAFDDYVVTAV